MVRVNDVEVYTNQMEFFRDWLHSHPNRVDPELRDAGLNWIEVEFEDMAQEMKNARLAGRTSRLRDRLKFLITVILTQAAERRQLK